MKDYGYDYPLPRRGWFRRNLKELFLVITGIGIVVSWAALFLLTFHLLPSAIEAELDRQIAVVEQQVTGGRE